jgi:hypothetical protein
VIGVSVADEACQAVSKMTARRKGVIRKTNQCSLVGRSNPPVRRMRTACVLESEW